MVLRGIGCLLIACKGTKVCCKTEAFVPKTKTFVPILHNATALGSTLKELKKVFGFVGEE